MASRNSGSESCLSERAGVPFVPVVTLSGGEAPPELLGALYHVDALKAYNRALAAVSKEEHG